MNNLYADKEFIYPNERKGTDGSRVGGDTWSAYKKNTVYVLEYILGELAGRLKQIEVSEDEYRRLANKQATVEQLWVSHNCF